MFAVDRALKERALRLVRERITLCRRDITKMIATGIEEGIPVVGTADAVLGTQREQVGAVLTRSIPAPSVRRRLF